MSTVALVRRFTSLSIILCLFNGCVGTETGNPSETRDVSIAMVLKSSNPAIVQNCPGETETACHLCGHLPGSGTCGHDLRDAQSITIDGKRDVNPFINDSKDGQRTYPLARPFLSKT